MQGISSAFQDAVLAWAPTLAGNLTGSEVAMWSRDIKRDTYAAELIDLHAASLELEENLASGGLDKQLNADSEWQPLAGNATGKVEHLGAGVIVQRNKLSIDRGSMSSPHTITRLEQRFMASLAIEAVQHRDSNGKVVVVGQAGIGKTRGGLAYTLQALLYQGKAVLRVGFKDNWAHLFLPQKGSTGYTVWRCKAQVWSMSLLVDEPDIFVLIDPPEEGPYLYAAGCLVIKYSSNNEKHYPNAHKDGVILVTATPTEDELLAMTKELWDRKSPFRSQRLKSLREKQEEVLKRARILGSYALRYIFSASAFKEELSRIEEEATGLATRLEGQPNALLSYLMGHSTGVGGHECSVSSRLFNIEPEEPGLDVAWKERSKANVQLKDIAASLMSEQLEKALNAFTGQDAFLFERFVQAVLECGMLSVPPVRCIGVFPRPSSHAETFKLMMGAMRQDKTSRPIYFSTSTNFPVVDFVTSSSSSSVQDPGLNVVQEWWNAKAGNSKVEVSSTAFVKLMRGLKLIDAEGMETSHFNNSIFKLRFICSSGRPQDAVPRFVDCHNEQNVVPNFQKAKELYCKYVKVEIVNATELIEGWRAWKLGSAKCLKDDADSYKTERPPEE